MFRQVAKKEWIKTAFWMPENAKHVQNEIQAPSKDLKCIYEHKITVKKLVKVNLNDDLTCQVCCKLLQF